MLSDQEVDESDCCGNGCVNCILDAKPVSSRFSKVDLSNKTNVLQIYHKYKLIQKVHLLEYIIQLKFIVVDKNQLMDYVLYCPPGHHLMMRAPDPDAVANAECKTFTRPYSPLRTDMTSMEFEILVNLKPNGKMTKYIQSLSLNDEVEFRGPIGTYMHESSAEPGRVLIIFSQGVAIAPSIPIVEQVLEEENDMTRVYHYSCFQDLENIILRDKLTDFNTFWNFSGAIYLSQQKCSECDGVDCEHFRKRLRYREQIFPHRLTADRISQEMGKVESAQKKIVVCGSRGFQEFVNESLLRCNVDKKNIFLL